MQIAPEVLSTSSRFRINGDPNPQITVLGSTANDLWCYNDASIHFQWPSGKKGKLIG